MQKTLALIGLLAVPASSSNFPPRRTNEFFKGPNEGIAAIANATEGPKEPKSFEDIISKDVD